jgi:hypothetical protein
MAKKLYVGNLSYATTEDALRTLFAEVGEVESVAIITDRMSGRSKGFGFVEMATEAAASEAIGRLNGHEVDGTWPRRVRPGDATTGPGAAEAVVVVVAAVTATEGLAATTDSCHRQPHSP